MKFKFYGNPTTFIIDTGTNLNIISKKTFMNMNQQPKLYRSFVNAYGFNADNPIPILGEFKATLRCNYRRVKARFLVLDGNADNLLGYYASRKLGLVDLKEEKIHHEWNGDFIRNVKETAKGKTLSPDFDAKKRFPNLFKERLGYFRDVEVTIETDDSIRPIQVPPYPIPLPLLQMTEAKIKKMLEDGIIERASGKITWLSPMHVVPKCDPVTKEVVGVRITSNNKALNKAIKLEKRFMPSIKTLTHELNGMSVFSKIDLRDAFNQILIADGSRQLTAFTTPWGVFRYCRLNMGLAIASEIFQNILSDILIHIPHHKLATDDIIVYGKDVEECERFTIMVLEALSQVDATLSEDKCEFMKSEISFFGHKISGAGLEPLEAKMEDFKNLKEPRSFKELHSFLGSAGYFNSRSPYQAEHTKCLRALLAKGGQWVWEEMHKDAMDKTKSSIIGTKLAHFNPRWTTELIVDAGPEACASFLTQVDPRDPEHRVLIHVSSHAFSAAEINYSHVEKEAYVCVWACIKDHLHLYGTRFNLITDNIGCQKIFEEDGEAKSQTCCVQC